MSEQVAPVMVTSAYVFDLFCDARRLEPGCRYCFYGMPQKTCRIVSVRGGNPELETILVNGCENFLRADDLPLIVRVGFVFACIVKVGPVAVEAAIKLQAHSLAID